MTITLDAPAAAALGRSLDRAAAAVGDLVEVNTDAGALVVGSVKVPTRTGFLASTVAVRADAVGSVLVATAPYAGYVHARTPFFTDAVTQQTDAVAALYLDHLAAVLATIQGA